MAAGQSRTVINRLCIGTPSDHGLDRATGRHGDNCPLTHTHLCAIGLQACLQRPLRRGLHVKVERCRNDQIFFGASDISLNLADDPVGEIPDISEILTGVDKNGRVCAQPFRFRCGQIFFIHHTGKDNTGPILRPLQIAGWCVVGGGLQKAGQHGRFGRVHLCCRFREIFAGGGINAVGAGAEIHAVEIKREDFIL